MRVFIGPYDTGGYQGGGFHGEVDHFVFDMKIEVFDPNDDWTTAAALLDAQNDSMGAARQPVGEDQLRLSDDSVSASPRPDAGVAGGTGPAVCEGSEATTALSSARALTENPREEACRRENLNRAYRRVQANKGALGVAGMTVRDWASG